MQEERARELLTKARDDTETELARVRGRGNETADDDDDNAGQADALVDRGTDDAVVEMLTRRLEAICRAERRLEAGTYGISLRSGEPIPDARLEIEPWAELTVSEQARRN